MFILDRKTIVQRAGNVPNILETLALIFIEELDNYLSGLEQALKENNAEQLRHQAHLVKGALATFADEEGTKMASQLEVQLKQQGIGSNTEQQVRMLQQRLHEVANTLNKELL